MGSDGDEQALSSSPGEVSRGCCQRSLDPRGGAAGGQLGSSWHADGTREGHGVGWRRLREGGDRRRGGRVPGSTTVRGEAGGRGGAHRAGRRRLSEWPMEGKRVFCPSGGRPWGFSEASRVPTLRRGRESWSGSGRRGAAAGVKVPAGNGGGGRLGVPPGKSEGLGGYCPAGTSVSPDAWSKAAWKPVRDDCFLFSAWLTPSFPP